MRLKTRHAIGLGALLLLAGAARFTGLAFGLPLAETRPDESTIIQAAWNVIQGDPNPHFFHYPSLLIYVFAAIFRVYGIFMGWVGRASALLSPTAPELFLLARAVSALCGVGTVWVVIRLGSRAYDRRTGMLAGLLLAVCYLHVRESHFATTDVPMTFLVVAAVSAILRVMHTPGLRSYVMAGVISGLACSTKYGAVFLAFPLLAAHAAANRNTGLKQLVLDRRLWLCAAATAAAFFLATPYALLDITTFLAQVTAEARHLSVGHSVFGERLDLGRGWVYHLAFTLPFGLGAGVFFLGLAAPLIDTLHRHRTALVLYLYPLVFFLVAGKGYSVFTRYMVPLAPFWCLAAARTCLVPLRRRGAGAWLSAAAILVAMVPSLAMTGRFDTLLLRRDSRLLAADWLAQRGDIGASVLHTGHPSGHVALPDGMTPFQRPRTAGTDTRPDYIVVPESLLRYTTTPDHIRQWLQRGYEQTVEIRAHDERATEKRYDRLDAFYLPYSSFRGIRRPGPNIVIFSALSPRCCQEKQEI